jgi:hypothetical protein
MPETSPNRKLGYQMPSKIRPKTNPNWWLWTSLKPDLQKLLMINISIHLVMFIQNYILWLKANKSLIHITCVCAYIYIYYVCPSILTNINIMINRQYYRQ